MTPRSWWSKLWADPLVPLLEEEVRYLRGLLDDFRLREKAATDALLAHQGKSPLPPTDPARIGALVDEYINLFRDEDGAVDPDRVPMV